MKFDKYDTININSQVFTFVSTGIYGDIEKIVIYEEIAEEIYNLGFGDRVIGQFDFDDIITTNNGDGYKVIATVISTIPLFFQKFPLCAVLFQGSDSRRTRIYQRIITKHQSEFEDEFVILGGKSGDYELFDKQEVYDSFLIFYKPAYYATFKN